MRCLRNRSGAEAEFTNVPAASSPPLQLRAMHKQQQKKTLMRSLGEFVGHIAKGLRTNPAKKTLRKEVREERRDDGVILRRTTIEEIELRPGDREG